jgi:hypothetical protein
LTSYGVGLVTLVPGPLTVQVVVSDLGLNRFGKKTLAEKPKITLVEGEGDEAKYGTP